MKNFIGVGNRVTLTAAAVTTSGQPVLTGSLFGIAENAAAIGEPLVLVMNGIYDLTKTASPPKASSAPSPPGTRAFSTTKFCRSLSVTVRKLRRFRETKASVNKEASPILPSPMPHSRRNQRRLRGRPRSVKGWDWQFIRKNDEGRMTE